MAPSAKAAGVAGKKSRAPVATASNAATEEAILARIAATGEFRAGLCEQVRAYVEAPAAEATARKENEGHARAKQLVPFLGRVLKQCALELGSIPVDGDTVGQSLGDELFGAMGVALDAFDRLRSWLVGGAIEIEMQRYSFMRRLVAWKRYRDAAAECRRILSSLNAHILSLGTVKDTGRRAATGGQKSKEVANVQLMESILPPPKKTEDITPGLPALLAGLVADLILCTIESGERHLEVLQNLANLPLQLEPWLRTMDAAAAEKQRESLFKGLYRISSVMVSQSCFKAETVLAFCKITLDWCTRSSQVDQYLKVARRLCSSLISTAPLTALDICAIVCNDLGCKAELRKFWRSCELLDFMEWYSKVCQNTANSDLGWYQICKFLESAKQADDGCLVASSGLYALSLKLPLRNNDNNQDMGIVRGPRAGYCEKAEEILENAVAGVCAIFGLGDSDVKKAIKVVGRRDDIMGECGAYLESENVQGKTLVSVFKALDSARRNLANYVQLEWDLFLSSDGEAEHSGLVFGLIKLLHLCCQTVHIGLRHDNLSLDEKEVFKKVWHGAPTAAIAALRLSLMVKRGLEESTMIIRELMSTIVIQSEDSLRWLISVTYNIGVQIYNKKQYDLACGPLELAHDAAWTRVDALTRISRAEDQSLVRDAVSEACLKTSAFVDCLKRSGNQHRGIGTLLNALICWEKARSQGFQLEGPQSILKLWSKSSLADPREECCLYSSLCCLQPPLPAASIGLLLEEQLLVLDDIDNQRTDIEVVKERIVEVLIDKVYLGESFALERSRILVEKTRIARGHGINNLCSSIMLLSEALHLLKEALKRKDTIGKQKMRLEYQSAVAYCLRAHCSQEADPFSQEYIADITSAIKIWRGLLGLLKGGGWNCFSSVERKSAVVQSEESVLCLLRSTADLLSLKGLSLLQNEMQELILEVAGQDFRGEDQSASIWAHSRITHVLCRVPFSKSFISIFANKFGPKVDMISFWCNHAKDVPGSLANARQSLVYADILGHAYDGEKFPQEFSKELERNINLARAVPPNGSNSARDIAAFAALKFYLAELLTQKGDIGAALNNATSCLQLRLKLLNRTFHISNRDAGTQSDLSSGKKTSSKFEASGTAATFAWPSLFTTNPCHGISQWHILGDYIESLMQVGVLYEKVGAADDAERSFREGLWISQAQNLPLACAQFASCLGEVHRKQHLWDFAEEDFHDARKALEDLDLDCTCSHCVLIGKAYLELRVGDFFRRCPNVDEQNGLHFACSSAAGNPDVALMHYESAITILNDHFCFQADSGIAETTLSNKRSKKLSENAMKESCQEFLHIKFDNKISLSAWIGYKWEQCGRRLMATLLLQKGKCNFELGKHDRVEEYYLQTMSLLHISQCFLSSSRWDWQLDNNQSMYPLEEAALLYHLSMLLLWRSANIASDEESAPPITWLYRAFVLCSSAPPLLRKVSQLLAILHALDVSTGKSSNDLKEFAAYFHQASLGSRIRQQHLLMLESRLDVLQTQQKVDQCKSKCIEEMIQALRVFREDNVNPAVQCRNLLDGLPPTTVCCISLLEKEFSFLLRTENSEQEPTVAAWLLISRFGDGDVLVSILPIQCVPQDSSSERHDIGSDVNDGENANAPEASDRRWRHRSILESDALVKNIMAELASILRESRQSTSCLLPISTSEEKSRWWKWRTLLDVRLASFLRRIEDSWFGPWKCFLLGEPSQISVAQAFQKKAKELCKYLRSKSFLGQNKLAKVPAEALVKVLLQGVGSLNKEQLHKAISGLLGWESHECDTGNTDEAALCKRRVLIEKAAELFVTSFASVASGDDPTRGLRSKTRRSSRKENLAKPSETSLDSQVVEREPIVLVLDGRLQGVPWESLPIMRKFEAYRMPSFGSIGALFLHHKHASLSAGFEISESLARLQLNEGAAGRFLKGASRPSVNPYSTFYLLNPGGDLESTQAAFEDWFTRQKGWEGKAGQVPTIDEYMAGLQQHDLFVYLGHGSGDQYFPEKYLRKLDNCPASLLMGCSSGRFSARGDYEPVGVPLSYLMAGCSLAIANLWDVTDGDIDRFSRVLLQRWLNRTENPSSEVRAAPADAKAPRRGRSSKLLQEADTESQPREWEEIYIGPSVEAGRESCRLPYLIGASPVCYGIPTIVLRSRNYTNTSPCE